LGFGGLMLMLLFKWSLPRYNLATFFLCFILTSISARAHVDVDPPVDFVPKIRGVVDNNRAGYGWLNSSSEADAEALFSRECPRNSARALTGACIPNNSDLLTAYDLAGHNLEAAMTSMVQERAFEYTALQMISSGASIGTPALPECLRNNPRMLALASQMEGMRTTSNANLEKNLKTWSKQIKNLEGTSPRTAAQNASLTELRSNRLMAMKVRAMRASFEPQRMSQALMLDHQLKNRERALCGGSGSDPMQCMSIRNNRDRIRLAFPVLFPGGVYEEQQQLGPIARKSWEERYFTSAGGSHNDACGRSAYNRLERSIARMIGLVGAPNPIPGAGSGSGTSTGPSGSCSADRQTEAEITRGEGTLTTHYSSNQGYPNLVSANAGTGGRPKGLWNQAVADAALGSGAPNYDPRLVAANADLTARIDDVKAVHRTTLTRSLSNICSNANFNDLARNFPQAVRQTVLDNNEPQSRDALLRVLCKTGQMARFQAYDQTQSCSGVTGAADNRPAGMTVNRTKNGFPFANDMNYNLVREADGSYTVKTKINYIFRYDQTVDPGSPNYSGDTNVPASARKTQAQQQAEFNTNTQGWVTRATEFYKKAGKSVTDPKVNFRIEVCSGCSASTKPAVKVGACYRRGAPPTNFATLFPGQTWDGTRCWYKNGVRQFGDWQDAGNFTLGTSDDTIMHETGHNMGLSDEYAADYYPAHALGEDGAMGCNSTMASSHAACHRIYPRHLLEITRPARVCPRP